MVIAISQNKPAPPFYTGRRTAYLLRDNDRQLSFPSPRRPTVFYYASPPICDQDREPPVSIGSCGTGMGGCRDRAERIHAGTPCKQRTCVAQVSRSGRKLPRYRGFGGVRLARRAPLSRPRPVLQIEVRDQNLLHLCLLLGGECHHLTRVSSSPMDTHLSENDAATTDLARPLLAYITHP